MDYQLFDITMNNRLAERSRDFLGLLVDGNGWSQLHRMRNLTSHTYDEAQALLVYRFVKVDGVRLFSELAARVQTWTQ